MRKKNSKKSFPRSSKKRVEHKRTGIRHILENQSRKTALSAHTAVIEGIFSASERGFGFVKADDRFHLTDDIFIPAKNCGGALSGDRVVIHVKKRDLTSKPDRKYHAEGVVVEIKQRGIETFCGTYLECGRTKRGNPIYRVRPDNPRLCFDVKVAEYTDARDGDKVLCRLTDYGDGARMPKGEILRVLGSADSLGANYESVLLEHGIRTVFSEEVLRTAEKAAAQPLSENGRLDLRDSVIFTIDGADAKDLDDAISLEVTRDGYRLGVHIADVSHYVRYGTPVDKEAFARGTSVYFTDKVVPMLPECLSNGVCSLDADTDKYALSALITLDHAGAITDCQIENTIIRSKVHGIYSEVNDLFKNHTQSPYYEKYKPVYKQLLSMVPLYKILAHRADIRGVLELESAEAKFVLNEQGIPVDIIRRERGDAERLIEQFMLTANEAVARYMCAHQLPCVFRIHEAPDEEKLTAYKNFIHNAGLSILPLRQKKLTTAAFAPILREATEKGIERVVSRVTLRAQMKAKYSEKRADHFGLGLAFYCHFTSPIRRYPDLSIHRILKYAMANGANAAVSKYARFAKISAEASSDNELRAMTAERDIEDLYKVIYMQKEVGNVFDAVVSSVTPFGLFCELENTCEGLIPIERIGEGFSFDENARTLGRGKTVYRLGQPIRIRITEANVLRRRIYMEPAEENSSQE